MHLFVQYKARSKAAITKSAPSRNVRKLCRILDPNHKEAILANLIPLEYPPTFTKGRQSSSEAAPQTDRHAKFESRIPNSCTNPKSPNTQLAKTFDGPALPSFFEIRIS